MPLVCLILLAVLHFPKPSTNACKQKKKQNKTPKRHSYSNASVNIQVLKLSCITHRGDISELFFHLSPGQGQ